MAYLHPTLQANSQDIPRNEKKSDPASAVKHDSGKPQLTLLSPECLATLLNGDFHTFSEKQIRARTAFYNISTAAHSATRAETHKYLLGAVSQLRQTGVKELINETAQAMAFGCHKYSRNNWKKGMSAMRMLDAALRHLLAYVLGEEKDEESGACHLGNAMFCLQCALYYFFTPGLEQHFSDFAWGPPAGGPVANKNKPSLRMLRPCTSCLYERRDSNAYPCMRCFHFDSKPFWAAR